MIVIVFHINEDEYYNALGISKDNDYELHLVRSRNSHFVNNYFKNGLLDCSEKMVCYECSLVTRQAAKEAFGNYLSIYKTLQEIAHAYVNKPECSVQEAVYHVLHELHLHKMFLGVCFANSNIPGNYVKI